MNFYAKRARIFLRSNYRPKAREEGAPPVHYGDPEVIRREARQRAMGGRATSTLASLPKEGSLTN